ncbi:MAG TPA: glycerate kinase, partial [Actinomycetota bacterium]|nr:glycerate kinase [Actinomycetota bacterium]
MRVVIAPDKFRGTLSAAEAAAAMAEGWQRVDHRPQLEQVPVADGGEGTLEALATALGAELHRARVTGPLGDPVSAAYAVAETPGGRVAVVEMAQASGLRQVSEPRRDAVRATTRGTGELVLAACAHRPRRVIVAVGGSATTDGGAGMAQAVGVRLLDERGRDLRPGGGVLRALARIDATGLDRSLRSVDVVVAADVDSPLLGPRGAARAFAPQKGAGPDEVALLEEALSHLAAVVHRDLGIDVRDVPGGGAAGGLGAGLVAF